MYAVIESRRWFPKYRAFVVDDCGKVIDERKFWTRTSARTWITVWTYDRIYKEQS